MAETEMKACPFCGEQILVVAKKCKHCGEFLDESARPSVPISAEEAKAQKLRVQETEVKTLKLEGEGVLTLTTKKIRGKIKAEETKPDGSKVTRVKDLDILLSLVTSTEVITEGASSSVVSAFIMFLLGTIACFWLMGSGVVSYVLAGITAILWCAITVKHYFIIITIGGQDIKIKINDKNVANDFVEEVRKQKAEYELKAGI